MKIKKIVVMVEVEKEIYQVALTKEEKDIVLGIIESLHKGKIEVKEEKINGIKFENNEKNI